MRIDTVRAKEYIHDNFTLDVTAFRLCEAIFEYWNDHCENGKIETCLMTMLDPIGFEEHDMERMISDKIIFPED